MMYETKKTSTFIWCNKTAQAGQDAVHEAFLKVYNQIHCLAMLQRMNLYSVPLCILATLVDICIKTDPSTILQTFINRSVLDALHTQKIIETFSMLVEKTNMIVSYNAEVEESSW